MTVQLAVVSGHSRTGAQPHSPGARAPVWRSRSWLGALSLLPLLAGCYESPTEPPVTTHVVAAEVRWLEWPAQVSSVVGESLRVVIYAPCGLPRLAVSASGETIMVTATEEVNLDGSCIGTGTGIYDTLLPLPALHPDEPPSLLVPVPFRVVAGMANYVTAALEPAFLGHLELTFNPPPQPRRLAAGRVRMSVDTGCAWVKIEGFESESHLVLNPLPAIVEGEQARAALIGGTYLPSEPPVCGRATGLHLRFAQVDLFP